jgi:GNAT superfamily N-acetyltransferase
MTITVRRCGVAEIFDDPRGEELMAEYAQECAERMLTAPEPQRDMYEQLEEIGMAQCFRCACDEEMAGFATVLLAPSAHNGKRYATVESLFVANEHRSTGAGTELMAVIEDAARAAGCEAIVYSAHVGSRLARILFLSSDRYVNTGYIFMRRLA